MLNEHLTHLKKNSFISGYLSWRSRVNAITVTRLMKFPGIMYYRAIFSDVLTAFSGAMDLGNLFLRNWNCHPLGFIRPSSCHLLGFICPDNFICSFLNFLFAYHLPPRQPKPYLQLSKGGKDTIKKFKLSSSVED